MRDLQRSTQTGHSGFAPPGMPDSPGLGPPRGQVSRRRVRARAVSWLGLALTLPLAAASPRLNEFMAVDPGLLPDEDGDARGWIELYNPGPEAVQLQNHGLSDSPGQPFKWRFPLVTLPARAHLVVFTSGKDRREVTVPLGVDPNWSPGQLPGLLLWLDAAAAGAVELEAGGVRRWKDRTSRPFVPPEITPLAPDAVPGLTLWLDADDPTTLFRDDDSGLFWRDKAGQGLMVLAPNANSSPADFLAENGRRYLRFDGTNDYLQLPRQDRVRTVLWVARRDPATDRFAVLLGDPKTYNFHGGEEGQLLSSLHAPGWSAWINGAEVDPYRTAAPPQPAIIALRSDTGGGFSLLGSDRLLDGRFWAGDLGELLCFDRVLSDAERAGLEEYLRRKWQPPEPPPPPGYDALQTNATCQPRLVSDPLSGLPALRFDGEDDHLVFPRLDRVQTVFWVARERPVPSGRFPTVLGDLIRFDLHRGEGGKIYHYLWAAREVLEGRTRLDGAEIEPDVTVLPERRLMLSTVTTGPITLGTVASGRLRERYFWGGDIHEILLFDRALAPAEVAQVETYLRAKWRLPERHLHTNFELNPAGGWVVLTGPDGRTLDAVSYGPLRAGLSYARSRVNDPEEPEGTFGFCAEPTPGRANTTPLKVGVAPPPQINPGGGFFGESVQVSMAASPGATVHYTLDGSMPRAEEGGATRVYAGPFLLQTSAVVRAQAFLPEHVPSEVVTVPFLTGTPPTLPVVSLVVEPEDLWSDTRGIYAFGPGASIYPPYLGANFYKAWERAAEFTWLETNGVPAYHAGAGVRIHGGYSRSAPQRSFRLYARREYGTGKFRHAFFPGGGVDEFESLVLRNTGNDWPLARMRDRLAQSLGAELGATAMRARPVVVWLNGAYWGHYDLTERADEHFLAEHFGVEPNALDLIENGSEIPVGDHRAYVQLDQFCQSQDLSDPTVYETVARQLDLDNLLAWHLTEIYLDNSDWPTHNTLLWRPHRPDGQWRWVLWDLDGTFDILKQGFARPTLRIALGLEPEFAASYPATVFLPQLLRNPGFRDTFLNRFADALNSVFVPAHVLERINTLAAELEPEMERHLARWRSEATYYWPVHTNLAAWQAEVEHLRAFARERPAAMRRQLVEHFGLAGTAELLVRVNDPARGRVRVNSLRLPAGTREWSGLYFRGVPVEVEALPEPGAEFAGWEELPGAPALVRLALDGVVELTAAFQPAGEPVPLPKPFALWQGEYRFDALPADTPPGTCPPAMIFLQTATRDPGLDAAFENPWTLPYNLTSRSRVNGLDGRGVSFLNTSNPQEVSGAGYLGAAVLALNTEGVRRVRVTWTGGTVTPNSRPYALRLQYRVGDAGPFTDVADAAGRPVEYRRSPVAGDFAVLGPVELPALVDNRPLVQLRWVYYRTGEGPDSGARDELRLDDIRVSAEPAPPKLRVVQELLTRRYWLEAAGLYRRPARVQSSDDLVHWTDEGAIEGGWDGRAARPLDPPLPETARFYRLLLP
jgi:hypothetical protein